MSDDNVVRPPGWRPTWRDPKPRGQGSRARVATPVAGPLPSDGDMRDEALRCLLSLCRDDQVQPAARVGAAKAILEHVDGRAGTADMSLDELEAKYERLMRAG